jgi:Outer membrane protein beta-barrel domain
MSMTLRTLAILSLMISSVTDARAQDAGARVSGFYAGAFGEGETNIAAGGAVGYRFTPRVGFELEAFALPDLEFSDTGDSGRGVAFLSNFVSEFPSPARWLTPYVQGGGGVANISQSRLFARIPDNVQGILRGRIPGRRDARPSLEDAMRVSDLGGRRNESAVALSVGGGVDFTVWRGLAVGPNITYLKLFGNLTDRDLTRIGFRSSYRF